MKKRIFLLTLVVHLSFLHAARSDVFDEHHDERLSKALCVGLKTKKCLPWIVADMIFGSVVKEQFRAGFIAKTLDSKDYALKISEIAHSLHHVMKGHNIEQEINEKSKAVLVDPEIKLFEVGVKAYKCGVVVSEQVTILLSIDQIVNKCEEELKHFLIDECTQQSYNASASDELADKIITKIKNKEIK